MIKAPDDASVDIETEDFSEDFLEAMRGEVERIVLTHLRELDPSINQDGITVWAVDPSGNIHDWYYKIDWELLKDEALIFCSNFSRKDGGEYEPEYINRIKRARDGFADLVAILDAELAAGKPSAAVMEKM